MLTSTYKNAYNNWTSETFTKVGGQDYSILTMKRHGGLTVSTATKITIITAGVHEMGESSRLIAEKIRGSEKNVKIQHEQALEMFEKSFISHE